MSDFSVSQAVLDSLSAHVLTQVHSLLDHSQSQLLTFQSSTSSLLSQTDLRLSTIESQLLTLQQTVSFLESDQTRQKHIHANHITEVSEVNLKIDKFSEDVSFIRNSILELNAEMTKKVTIEEISKITQQVNEMCPLKLAEEIEKEVKLKAIQTDFSAFLSDFQSFREQIPLKYLEKHEFFQQFRKLDEKHENSIKSFVNSNYFTRVYMEMQKTIDLMRNKIDEFTGEYRSKVVNLKEELNHFKGDLNTKATLAQIHEIKRNLSLCAAKNSVDSLFSQFKSCENLVNSLKTQINTSLNAQDQVLERYDEMFLEKASKLDVKELDLKVNAVSKHINFERRVDEMEGNLEKCVKFAQECSEEMMGNRGKMEYLAGVVKGVKSEKREIAVLKANLKEVMENMQVKADKSQISELIDQKASATDVRGLTKALGAMHRLDKLTLVLLQHTIKYLKWPREAKGGEFGSIDWLVKHAELVSAWAAVYEPIQNEVEPPPDLLTFPSPMKSVTDKSPTSPVRPTTAAMALLTPTRKSRPLTPSSFGRTATLLRTSQRLTTQRPSIDTSLLF